MCWFILTCIFLSFMKSIRIFVMLLLMPIFMHLIATFVGSSLSNAALQSYELIITDKCSGSSWYILIQYCYWKVNVINIESMTIKLSNPASITKTQCHSPQPDLNHQSSVNKIHQFFLLLYHYLCYRNFHFDCNNW